jgi:hypothetical protein
MNATDSARLAGLMDLLIGESCTPIDDDWGRLPRERSVIRAARGDLRINIYPEDGCSVQLFSFDAHGVHSWTAQFDGSTPLGVIAGAITGSTAYEHSHKGA